jgi:hypothetical protein
MTTLEWPVLRAGLYGRAQHHGKIRMSESCRGCWSIARNARAVCSLYTEPLGLGTIMGQRYMTILIVTAKSLTCRRSATTLSV